MSWRYALRWVAAICSALSLTSVAVESIASDALIPEKRAITYDDLDRATEGDALFDLSSDGKHVAYQQHGDIFLRATKSYPVTVDLGKGFAPRFSPDASKLAYYSSATGSVQLWVYDLHDRASRPVTALPAGIDSDPRLWLFSWAGPGQYRFDWSPDSMKLVFGSRVPENPPNEHYSVPNILAIPNHGPLVLNASSDADLTISGIFPDRPITSFPDGGKAPNRSDASAMLVQQLFVARLKETQANASQLTTGSAGCFQPAWSPDGTTIACVTTEGSAIDGSLETADIVRVDAVTGRRLGETSGKGLKYLPTWSRYGEHVVFLENENDGVYGVPTLYAWDWRRGAALPLTPELHSRVRRYQVDANRDEVLFLYRDGLRTLLERVGFDGRPPRLLRAEDEQRRPFEFVLDRQGNFAWSLITSNNPGLIELVSGSQPNTNSRTIVDLNPDSAHWLLGRRRAVHWTNARGDKLDGIVIEPPHFDPKRRYPTIVDAYPLFAGDQWGELSGNQVWASRGYLIFVPAARGPHVWMNDWSTRRYGLAARGRGGWDVTQDDLMSGVNELIAQGLIDRNRMCIYGHSNGGAVALNVIARTNEFACAVAVAPVVLDWLTSSTLETNADAWTTRTVGSASVFDDPDTYLRLSVLYRASAIATPTLLAIGDHDAPESVLAAIEMFNSMRDLHRDVTLLRYQDEGHVFHGAAMKDFWDRELKFFDEHLRSSLPLSSPPPDP